MISVTITNSLGEHIECILAQPEKTGFLIADISGLNPPGAVVNVTDSALTDGGTFTSSRLEKRNIVFTIIAFENNETGETPEQLRNKTYKYFPIKRKITMKFVTESKTVTIDGYVEKNEATIFTSRVGAQISVICPDPNFYDITTSTQTFFGNEPTFEYPFSNESLTENLIEYGRINMNTVSNIYYEGSVEVGFIVNADIIHRMSYITLFNLKTRKQMTVDITVIETITGLTVAAGDRIIIDSRFGKKSIQLLKAGIYYNVLGSRQDGGSWLTLVPGDNVLAFKTDGTYGDVNVNIERNIIYEGL